MTATKKVLVSFNSFKGSLSSGDACRIAAEALSSHGFQATALPIGDGGLGTVDALFSATGGEWEEIEVSGPLGKKTKARLLWGTNRTHVYIEGAQTFGHHLISAEEREALRASSRGLGEAIGYALKRDPQKLYVGLGDSSISDAGMGLLAGLGVRFLDRSGREVIADANGLRLFERWELPKSFPKLFPKITVLCDVLNPLCGASGSARVFSPQKGATPAQVILIEQGMEHFAAEIEKHFAKPVRSLPMTGSAGGVATALYAFLGAELVQGSRYLLNAIGFDEKLAAHDILLTGEGKCDAQTLSGKGSFECLKRAGALDKASVIIAGALGEGHEALRKLPGVIGVHACGREPSPSEALKLKTLEVFLKGT